MTKLVLVLALVGSIVAIPMPHANALDNALTLSAEQQSRLAGGEVVLLDVLPPGVNAQAREGGTAIVHVHASTETVWRVLVDYQQHIGLYPRVVGAEVLEADARHALVRYTVGVGPFSFGFHVDNFPDQAHRRLDWKLARARANGLFRDTWGYWQIEPEQTGVTLTYAMAAQTLLPSFLTRGAERDGLVETVKAVRTRAEALASLPRS